MEMEGIHYKDFYGLIKEDLSKNMNKGVADWSILGFSLLL